MPPNMTGYVAHRMYQNLNTPKPPNKDDEDFYFDEWLLLFLQKLKLKPCEADMVISVKPFLPHADTCLSDS